MSIDAAKKSLFQLADETGHKVTTFHYHNRVFSCLLDGERVSVEEARKRLTKAANTDIEPPPNLCPKCKSASTDCGCD